MRDIGLKEGYSHFVDIIFILLLIASIKALFLPISCRFLPTKCFFRTIDWCKWVQTQAEDLGWEISDVLKAFEINQLEKANALALRDGDAKDEQQAGFGELFESLNSAILDLSDSCKR